MIRIHKEGRSTIAIAGIIIAGLIYLMSSINQWWSIILVVVLVILFGLVLYFFRLPDRSISGEFSTLR